MAPFDRSFYIIFIFEIHDMNYGKLIFLLELTWNDPAVFKNKKENKKICWVLISLSSKTNARAGQTRIFATGGVDARTNLSIGVARINSK